MSCAVDDWSPGFPSAEVRSADGSTVLGAWPSSATARLGIAQAPNGAIYDVDVYGNVTVREPLTGDVLATISGPGDLEPDQRMVGGSALNAEAAVAAFVQHGDLRVEDLTTGRTRTVADNVADVAFAGDTMTVRRVDGTYEIRSVDGTQVLAAHGENTGFDPSRQAAGNDTLRAHVMNNSRVSLLDTRTNVEIGSFPMSREVDADKAGATFTPDGATLLVAAPGGSASEVQRWSVSPPDWIRIACNTAGRDLLDTEWQAATKTGAPADLRCSR